MTGRPLKVYMIAGEASGDQLGSELLTELKAQHRGPLEVRGIGGQSLRAAGMESLFPMQEIAVMGLVEILPRLRSILRRIRQTVDDVYAFEPDVLITIDAQGFSAKVGKAVRERLPAARIIQFVAPTVWAWKPWRARKLAGYLDHILVLFPFEPPYFECEGLGATFVGHPVLERVPQFSQVELGVFRDAFRLVERPVLVLLPGSRRGEIKRHLPLMRAVLDQMASEGDLPQLVLPLASSVAGAVKAECEGWPYDIRFIDPDGLAPADADRQKFAAFRLADAALTASGTVSLELALSNTPMVAIYKASPITAFIVRRLVKINTASLVNILAERTVVPEFLQERCVPGAVRGALASLMNDGPERQAQQTAFGDIRAKLAPGGQGAAAIAARTVLEVANEN